MHSKRGSVHLASFLILALSGARVVPLRPTEQAKKPFTVADEIGLTLFGTPNGLPPEVHFSPDGNYFAVWTERGRLDLNRVEDSLRFYRSQEVENFLGHSDESQPLSPIWGVIFSSDQEGPVINDWRWLADSSGVAFLRRTAGGNQQLVLADIQKRMIKPLTSVMATVKSFDVRDRTHYVYTVADPVPLQKMRDEGHEPSIVGTGRSLSELLLPDDPITTMIVSGRKYLWAVVGGKRFEVKPDGVPSVLFGEDLALSPDGGSLVTTVPVPEVPPSWETLYPPSFASSPYRIRAGHADARSRDSSANQYVRINLQTGSIEALTDAPIGNDAGWWSLGVPSWSNDGQAILLLGTFIRSTDQTASRPCVAVVDLAFKTRTCVEMLKGHTEKGVEEGYHFVKDARFVGGDRRRVLVTFNDHQDQPDHTIEYRRTPEGVWQAAAKRKRVHDAENNGLEVAVEESFMDPPRLIATNKQRSRVIWDPNPQLKNVELGQASVYTWKDKEGRDWRGGLYKPSNYKEGQRYPLVLQTHGFEEFQFRPSGLFPSGFAARALASTGIFVLQVNDDHCATLNPEEGPCAVSGYESAATRLVSEGLVDPEKIGIIGFSRTCFYVMEMLTTGSSHIKAALITDGFMVDYLQYMMMEPGSAVVNEADSVIGAQPFGVGLQQWLKRSPGFNLDKVNAPLLVVGEGPASLLSMWQPYAGLRHLQKPVDLIMLNTDEHVLTNPAVRMASQGTSVDWFRFWLNDEEDLDPTKAEQYIRWRKLRQLQATN
ncbi:MAG: hypothetical protein ABSG08_06535 [Terriglobales bacterium]